MSSTTISPYTRHVSNPPWLPATAYAVLGLLASGERRTAYDLKQLADRTVAHVYWAPAMSAVYAELQRLEGLSLVAHDLEEETEHRLKRVYRITPAGLEALRSWVEAGRERTVTKNSTLLRMLFGTVSSADALAALATEHAARCRVEIEEIEAAVAVAAPGSPAALALGTAGEILEAEAAAIDRLAARLGATGRRAAGRPRPPRRRAGEQTA